MQQISFSSNQMISMIEYEKLFKEKKELEDKLKNIKVHLNNKKTSKERKTKTGSISIGKNTHIIFNKIRT